MLKKIAKIVTLIQQRIVFIKMFAIVETQMNQNISKDTPPL